MIKASCQQPLCVLSIHMTAQSSNSRALLRDHRSFLSALIDSRRDQNEPEKPAIENYRLDSCRTMWIDWARRLAHGLLRRTAGTSEHRQRWRIISLVWGTTFLVSRYWYELGLRWAESCRTSQARCWSVKNSHKRECWWISFSAVMVASTYSHLVCKAKADASGRKDELVRDSYGSSGGRTSQKKEL